MKNKMLKMGGVILIATSLFAESCQKADLTQMAEVQNSDPTASIQFTNEQLVSLFLEQKEGKIPYNNYKINDAQSILNLSIAYLNSFKQQKIGVITSDTLDFTLSVNNSGIVDSVDLFRTFNDIQTFINHKDTTVHLLSISYIEINHQENEVQFKINLDWFNKVPWWESCTITDEDYFWAGGQGGCAQGQNSTMHIWDRLTSLLNWELTPWGCETYTSPCGMNVDYYYTDIQSRDFVGGNNNISPSQIYVPFLLPMIGGNFCIPPFDNISTIPDFNNNGQWVSIETLTLKGNLLVTSYFPQIPNVFALYSGGPFVEFAYFSDYAWHGAAQNGQLYTSYFYTSIKYGTLNCKGSEHEN